MRITALGLVVLLAAGASVSAASKPAPKRDDPRKQILVCVSDSASPEIRRAAEGLVSSVDQVPVLRALRSTQGAGPAVIESSQAVLNDYTLAAYNHLVVVGLADNDPLIDKIWEHYASIDMKAKSFYAQGWGHLSGDLGYIEADRNPFLHTRRIKEAPFETVVFKITGTSEAGLLAAVKAFQAGSLNGIIPAGKLDRPQTTILDLDPLIDPAPITLPDQITLAGLEAKANPTIAPLAGWTQVPANEYRGYADLAGFEPRKVWRCKYLAPGAFDRAGIEAWLEGFHRMAWGNAVTIAQFASDEEALKTAHAIAATGGWNKCTGFGKLPAWEANQPAAPKNPGDPKEDETLPNPSQKITAVVRGDLLLLIGMGPEAARQLLNGTTDQKNTATAEKTHG
jgi:hypothetical protein